MRGVWLIYLYQHSSLPFLLAHVHKYIICILYFPLLCWFLTTTHLVFFINTCTLAFPGKGSVAFRVFFKVSFRDKVQLAKWISSIQSLRLQRKVFFKVQLETGWHIWFVFIFIYIFILCVCVFVWLNVPCILEFLTVSVRSCFIWFSLKLRNWAW